jgi:hypothetical protein
VSRQESNPGTNLTHIRNFTSRADLLDCVSVGKVTGHLIIEREFESQRGKFLFLPLHSGRPLHLRRNWFEIWQLRNESFCVELFISSEWNTAYKLWFNSWKPIWYHKLSIYYQNKWREKKNWNKNTLANKTISILGYLGGDELHNGCIQHSIHTWVIQIHFICIFCILIYILNHIFFLKFIFLHLYFSSKTCNISSVIHLPDDGHRSGRNM